MFDTTLGLDFSKFGTYNGGAGTDTIELRDTAPGGTTRTGLPLIGYSFFNPGMLKSIERADFVSAAGTEINLFMVMRTVDAGTAHHLRCRVAGRRRRGQRFDHLPGPARHGDG